MNYYKARQIMDGESQGKWHYTCENDGKIWAVGHCSDWKTCPACEGKSGLFTDIKCENCLNKGIVKVENPCPGHETSQEAEEHYKAYILENASFSGPKTEQWPKYKCDFKDCNQEGIYLANVDYGQYYQLCPDHANKESLTVLVEVGDCWSS